MSDREQQAQELNAAFLAARAEMGCRCVMMGVTWNSARQVFDFNHEETWIKAPPDLVDDALIDVAKWAAARPFRCRQIGTQP